ncbi:PHP domain-containing protein [Butyrivibrio sp. YAB3001]|uniref:PHP domain-containing protein n=1 Tax=Butyrivibrio sp. YAB3001 TaxID=1520812 RepID=UPI0008F61E44|nr:PHP domain-containing protein [Butyrivibrio sp. YAB3001]SFC22715.1 hypothetical protein SAMN02910398_01805 [Butyrivibrio sp. YAB3001]
MNYIYETHLHTIEASACSDTPAENYIEYMSGLGYSGIIVTDHFFNGNCAVPRNLPWKEKVEIYCSGYEHALEKAKGTGFTVLFGIEYNFEGDEYLLYGVDKKWLLEHPDVMDKSRSELSKMIHEAGGIMVQAHPYRERDYLDTIHLAAEFCDGAESFNAANPDWQNALGYKYAREKNLRMSGGSDIHRPSQENMGGMSFPYKIETIQDYIKAFLAGDGTPVFRKNVHEEGTKFRPVIEENSLIIPDRDNTLPVIVHNI